MSLIVIGCGNPDRGDDAAGILVARRLRELGVDARENRGDLVSLLDTWEGYEQAIIVDAVVTGADPGAAIRFDARQRELPRGCFRSSTHQFGVSDAVELARLLDRLPPRLWIYGIEAAQFAPGSEPTPAVAAAVETVAREILCMKPL